jgi:hypothetical protein
MHAIHFTACGDRAACLRHVEIHEPTGQHPKSTYGAVQLTMVAPPSVRRSSDR